jgi:OmcA/MtrC family decaheme c-type cytochrome
MLNGAPVTDTGDMNQLRFGFALYDSATGKFPTAGYIRDAIAATGTPGQFTATANSTPVALELANAEVYGYAAEGPLETEGMTLYDNVSNAGMAFGDAASYMSAANVEACTRCHGTPYMKHGYRDPIVDGLADFASCKMCHYDTRNGGHVDWQILVDNPPRYAELHFGDSVTTEERTQYAYTANVMSDVHMSHAMEFPYPMSMANCATCHDGKLAMTTTDANFTGMVCKTCHAVTGNEEYPPPTGRAPALLTLWEETGTESFHNMGLTCNECHKAGGVGPTFADLHGGYNSEIYADNAGTMWSDIFTASVDSADLNGTTLTVNFSATGAGGGLTAADIVPTLMVGLYGYDTFDYIVGPHSRDADRNRLLEWAVDSENPRFTLVSAANGMWEADVDLSMWEDMIADGIVKRAEIAVMPQLQDADGMTVALDAPSKTFNLVSNGFEMGFGDIVDVQGCNACHDALATTFHSGNRGGNVKVCRLCHVPSSGGSHLEMQSRSIDSYVHAIHSFQDFDPGDIDFTDDVETTYYELHTEHTFPNFTILNCEACHMEGTFEASDNSKRLPAVLSRADTWNVDRNIGAVPSYVTGPGSKACGGCHRAELINEDDAGKLASFNQHTKAGGYLVEDGVWDDIVAEVMALFAD